MQAFAGVAHQLSQAGLDVQVYVFQVELPLELAGLDLGADLRHAAHNGRLVFGGEDALVAQHLGMRQRAGNVGLPQPLVKKHAGGVAFDQVAHGLGKQRRPGL